MRIVTFKTAYYSFYLPVACGLIIGGKSSDEDLEVAKDICLQMGQYFQASPCGSTHCHNAPSGGAAPWHVHPCDGLQADTE